MITNESYVVAVLIKTSAEAAMSAILLRDGNGNTVSPSEPMPLRQAIALMAWRIRIPESVVFLYKWDAEKRNIGALVLTA